MARAKALLGLEEGDLNGVNHVNRPSSSHQEHEFDSTAVQHHSVTPGNLRAKAILADSDMLFYRRSRY